MRGFSVKEDSAYTPLFTHPRERHYNDKGMKCKYLPHAREENKRGARALNDEEIPASP